MSGQDSNVAQVDGSAAQVSSPADASSNSTPARGNVSVPSAIHNAFFARLEHYGTQKPGTDYGQ